MPFQAVRTKVQLALCLLYQLGMKMLPKNQAPLPFGLLAKGLFTVMDLVYGRKRDFDKFEVLELVARVPYQAWENVGYVGVTHTHSKPSMARRVFDFVQEARAQQDNEQWHLLIMEEQVNKRGSRLGFIRRRVIPQILALFYYHISWLLYVLNPGWSYKLNADFETHAEHEYYRFIEENPHFQQEAFESAFEEDYGSFPNIAAMLHQIALDEREHKEESLAHLDKPRFGVA